MILVSLPYFRTPYLIRRAVDSILGQTFKDLRLVVINDGGPDPWKQLSDITDPRLIRFDLPVNRGRYYCDAVALAACPDDLFMVHDSDDWSESTRIEKLMNELGEFDGVVDGYTRHGTNGEVQIYKPAPNLIGHRAARSLWHIAHHKGLWRTDALRRIGMYPVRVGWDTYLMHFAASELKLNWVRYFGYHQERRTGSLITGSGTGIQSKLRKEAITIMDGLWNAYVEAPESLTEILKPPVDISVDVNRLRELL